MISLKKSVGCFFLIIILFLLLGKFPTIFVLCVKENFMQLKSIPAQQRHRRSPSIAKTQAKLLLHSVVLRRCRVLSDH